MINKIQSFINKKNLFSKDDSLLLAISGGGDRVFLFFILQKLGYTIELAHCNFNLRGNESDEDERFVNYSDVEATVIEDYNPIEGDYPYLGHHSDDSDEDDEEIFSQVESVFSQVSLEDHEECTQSPAVKRIKLGPQVEEEGEEFSMPKNRCPHCKVYISGHLGQINRHILKSCPESPSIDPLEAERRKKKLQKKLGKEEDHFKSDIKMIKDTSYKYPFLRQGRSSSLI